MEFLKLAACLIGGGTLLILLVPTAAPDIAAAFHNPETTIQTAIDPEGVKAAEAYDPYGAPVSHRFN